MNGKDERQKKKMMKKRCSKNMNILISNRMNCFFFYFFIVFGLFAFWALTVNSYIKQRQPKMYLFVPWTRV